MKIAMIGAGAGGSVFASYLRLGGADITLVDRYQAHMDAVARSGMQFIVHQITDEGCYENTVRTITGFQTACTADGIGVMDIVIFLTKSTQLGEAIESAKACIGPGTVLAALMNGLGNDEVLAAHHPAERCLFGCGGIGTALDGPGICVCTPNSATNIYLGPVAQSEANERAGRFLAECFSKGGLTAEYTTEIQKAVWRKAIHNSAANTVCSVLRMPQGAVNDDPRGAQLYHRVIREGIAVAEKKGIHFDPEDYIQNYYNSFMSSGYDYFPSMAQDVLINKRPTEISTLNAAISRIGREVGVPTPTNDVLSLIISCIEANYDKQYNG